MARIIDVISHPNVGNDELAYREPPEGNGDWRMGSQVIVNEGQAAVFCRSGDALDVFGPGRHTLSTANLPILSGVIGMATSGRNPFTADLYYVNLKDLPQVGWGTNPPIPMLTPGMGMGVVLLIGHGVIDISISDPMRFVKQYAVGKPVLRLGDIKDRIQAMILGQLAETIGKSGAGTVMDVNNMMSDLKGAILAQMNEKFDAIGMRIKAFEANPFQAKADVTTDELRNYITPELWERIRRLEVAEKAAENEGLGGGLAGAGVGFGVGQQIGAALNPDAAALQQQLAQQNLMMQQMMMKMMEQQGSSAPQSPPAAPTSDPLTANPQTKEEIEALLDALDAKLVAGQISESIYNRLVEKWQKRLDSMA